MVGLLPLDVPSLTNGAEHPQDPGPSTDRILRVWTWNGCGFIHAKGEGMNILFWKKYEVCKIIVYRNLCNGKEECSRGVCVFSRDECKTATRPLFTHEHLNL
jgi:hypothetical protein